MCQHTPIQTQEVAKEHRTMLHHLNSISSGKAANNMIGILYGILTWCASLLFFVGNEPAAVRGWFIFKYHNISQRKEETVKTLDLSQVFASSTRTNKTQTNVLLDRPGLFGVMYVVGFGMQTSHQKYGPVLQAHLAGSGKQSQKKLLRRLVRTVTFGAALLHSGKATEKRRFAVWLNDIHGGISEYTQEGQLLVLSTFAWVLVKVYQIIGTVPIERLDALVDEMVSTAMKFLNPDTDFSFLQAPTNVAELESYIRNQQFDVTLAKDTIQRCQVCDLFRFDTAQTALCKAVLGDKKVFGETVTQRSSWLLQIKFQMALLGLRLAQPINTHFHNILWPTKFTMQSLLSSLLKAKQSSRFPVESQLALECYKDMGGRNKAGLEDSKLKNHNVISKAVAPFLKGTKMAVNLVAAVSESTKTARLRSEFAKSGKEGGVIPPRHLGIIMDGSRRFAKEQKLGVAEKGHESGSDKLQECIVWAASIGIENLTVWGFSSDNFNRPEKEKEGLFRVFRDGFFSIANSHLTRAVGVRVRVIGELDRFPPGVREAMAYCENKTRHNHVLNLTVAAGYGGQDEIVQAARACQVANEELTTENLQKHTYLGRLGLPPVDSIIRTSGENRLSGFMLWESQYAEFAILDDNWPAVKESEFYKRVLALSRRQRRLGK